MIAGHSPQCLQVERAEDANCSGLHVPPSVLKSWPEAPPSPDGCAFIFLLSSKKGGLDV